MHHWMLVLTPYNLIYVAHNQTMLIIATITFLQIAHDGDCSVKYASLKSLLQLGNSVVYYHHAYVHHLCRLPLNNLFPTTWYIHVYVESILLLCAYGLLCLIFTC